MDVVHYVLLAAAIVLHNEADNAFARLYPLLFHDLKRIMTELPQRSAEFGEFEQYVRNGNSRKSVSMNMPSENIFYMVMGDNVAYATIFKY